MSFMSTITPSAASSIDSQLDDALVSIGFGVNPGNVRNACRSEVFRLSRKTDDELAALGLRRNEILTHVVSTWFSR